MLWYEQVSKQAERGTRHINTLTDASGNAIARLNLHGKRRYLLVSRYAKVLSFYLHSLHRNNPAILHA
jgi:hypothetical protein